ncbi:MAG: hypothetical protein ACUVX8_14675 [Candidatus Zipacnadales bacterium]
MWALYHYDEWQEAIAVARENIAHNGCCGWSLEQLAKSYMAAGDFPAAQETLAEIDRLPKEAIGSAQNAIDGSRQQLLELTGQCRYELHWQVDLSQGGPDQLPARLLVPRWDNPHQDFEFTVSNGISYKRVTKGNRFDYLSIQGFHCDGKVVALEPQR